MNDKEPKYPTSLFIIGVLQNITKNFLILIIAIAFFVLGIWLKWCLIAGAASLVLAVVIAIIEQIHIRNEVINSDNPEFQEWKNAMMSGNWMENIKNMVESKMQDPSNCVHYEDDEDEDTDEDENDEK